MKKLAGDTPNILFLDIDGVLNSELWFRKRSKSNDTRRDHDLSMIDPDAVEYLNDFVTKTECRVILSSTWRRNTPLDEMTSLLKEKGFEHEVTGATPAFNDPHSVRGNEIRAWLKNNISNDSDFNRYVIFDDSSDMLLWQKDNFFRTDPFTGLTPNLCWRAEYFLDHIK